MTGDFDSDGRADLLVVREGDPNLGDNGDATNFLGNGDATFRKGQTLAPGKNPSAATVADLNADHKLDLIFANRTDNTLSSRAWQFTKAMLDCGISKWPSPAGRACQTFLGRLLAILRNHCL